ncbi:serine/threonine-protein phosphatase 4 regulatory subunit 4-like isoform X3 [Tribolium madens]|uniref:serine/threonine-protein phosphatase 4 regulatory subunit 4-like isoform X3 n=1 Tax=Tribolium madens TaxID=41895 RepID=UPI001CF744B3|nr:serine/threonine-protein phosphatase 4 regulatory subunit 4-like isoform X3 [Tribolium madens]
MDEELTNLQLDRPSVWGNKTNEQLAKHTIDSQFESKPIDRSLHLLRKGDDIQKLSVIQALPQILQYDPNGTLTRLVPKIQQELPKSSCEFHIATSKIFKLLIEKQLPLNLTGAVIQGTESKDPVVSNAWTETLLAVIPILPIDQIKSAVIPLALAKSQPSSPVYCRVSSCKILGKCASHPKMQSIDVKASILPAVQSLCQDCFQDVRATMCAQLHFIAQGLGESLVKTSLLPSLVELASDDNMAVRSAAVASAVLMIPYLNKQTKLETIVPLIKQLCQKTSGPGDTTYPTIAREYGKLVSALQSDLEVNDCVWTLQFFKTLASKGQTVRVNKDNLEVTQDVLCREQCAYNLPPVTQFTVARIPNQLELWHTIFSGLANDSCYIVRKTTAACMHDIAKILGPQCKIIKDDLIKLLRDDAEEVLQLLVPHVGPTLELLCANGVLSRESNTPACLEIARALLKCQNELAKSYNWRIKSNFLQQLERLPFCMTSDFIHQHFSPVILNCVLEARPKPVRSQASRTLLIFLRYNLKEVQRKWIRDNLVTHLCYAKSCYTRHIFILACVHAAELFSNNYFKKHFFETLLTLADDPISNIRLCVIGLLPILYKMLIMPEDRKLQTNIDNIFSKLDMTEKDKDVKDILKTKLKEIRSIGPSNKHDYLVEQRRKEEEENKIIQGKLVNAAPAAGNNVSSAPKTASSPAARDTPSTTSTRSQPITSRSTPRVPTKTPSIVSKSPSSGSGPNPAPSDMSFLEQHFYIDAGVSLPHIEQPIEMEIRKVVTNFDQQLNLYSGDPNIIPTVSVENVNIETMSESELKKLETSTTNITDDVKVNLRKRTKKSTNRKSLLSPPKEICLKYKRYSSVFPSDSSTSNVQKTTLNRRSLNIGAGDLSKIPVCVKKSHSNADIENVFKCGDGDKTNKSSGRMKYKPNESTQNKVRPKSEILTRTDKQKDDSVNNSAITASISKNNVPITSISKEKVSGLPVLKKRTQSDVKSK